MLTLRSGHSTTFWRPWSRPSWTRNWTAYSSLMRQRLQFHGLLKDHLIMSQTDTDPEHMISSLAASDTELAAALHRVIGSYAGFTQH